MTAELEEGDTSTSNANGIAVFALKPNVQVVVLAEHGNGIKKKICARWRRERREGEGRLEEGDTSTSGGTLFQRVETGSEGGEVQWLT